MTAKLQSYPLFTSTQYGDCDQTWFLSSLGSHKFFFEGISIKIIIKLTTREAQRFFFDNILSSYIWEILSKLSISDSILNMHIYEILK